MKQPVIAQFKLNYGEFQLEVDLQLPETGITVLFGHSGSGKTTLLRCIAGLQQAPQGYLRVNDTVWQDHTQNIFVPTFQRALGYVFQEANLFPHLTVAQNLQYGLKRIPKSTPKADLQHILELLGIQHLLQRMPTGLSGGEKQRVAIARALALNPAILLMDEPLASLDNPRKQELLPYFIRMQQELKIPMLYVTHSQQEVAQLADHIVLMASGKVLAAGALTETLSRLDLPLIHEPQASSIWHAKVVAHDDAYHLTYVACEAASLCVSKIAAPLETSVRVQIFASDVSIALAQPVGSSIQNILPAIIEDFNDDDAGHCVVRLSVGKHILLAHITRKSKTLLNLHPKLAVFVQIKGTSIFI